MVADDTGDTQRCEWRDDFQFDNRVKLPELVVSKILQLIKQDNVGSVSCLYDDTELWRQLVAEQVRRWRLTGLSPQEAFTLSGPDGGLWDAPVQEWGGYVHIPYEGVRDGDLFIFAMWESSSRRMRKERVDFPPLSARVATMC